MEKSELICTGPDPVELITLETPGLGNRSYVAIADGWAVAIDVQRDLDRVQEVLVSRGVQLAAVAETHIHNDYVTGGLALARHWDAEYIVPEGPRLSFDARRAGDGESVKAGPVNLRIIDSPGHTDAHSSYSLHVGDAPALAAFTGGSLLLGGTGRTDLLGWDRAPELAVKQYWTARRLARLLPPQARLLPTHGFGSHCLAGDAVKCDTDMLADQLEINPAFLLDEQAFVEDMLNRVGPIPPYFPMMAPRNVAGPKKANLSPPRMLGAATLAQLAEAGETVIDVRTRGTYGEGHLPGSLSIDAAGSVATWTGWVADVDAPIAVVAEDLEQLAYVQRELSRIGVDQLVGAHIGPLHDADVELATSQITDFRTVSRIVRSRKPVSFVDVRDCAEWAKGHIRGAVHAPVYEVVDTQLPENPYLYCGIGFRASIASSLLARQGVDSIIIDDSIARARKTLPWCESDECTDGRCAYATIPSVGASG